jgi:hypothetical protein
LIARTYDGMIGTFAAPNQIGLVLFSLLFPYSAMGYGPCGLA